MGLGTGRGAAWRSPSSRRVSWEVLAKVVLQVALLSPSSAILGRESNDLAGAVPTGRNGRQPAWFCSRPRRDAPMGR